MKTIALFGGSGRTGKEVLIKALEAGYAVRALVQNPAKIQEESPQLEIIKGDVLKQEDVDHTVEHADVVVSVFGHVKGAPKDLQTQGTRHILCAMDKHHVHKIISLSGGGLPFEKDQPKIADYLIRGIMKVFVSKILKDAKDHAEVLQASSQDWVIVRAPRLTKDLEQGEYKVGWVGTTGGTKIGRADLADFILRQVETEEYHQQMPFVSY